MVMVSAWTKAGHIPDMVTSSPGIDPQWPASGQSRPGGSGQSVPGGHWGGHPASSDSVGGGRGRAVVVAMQAWGFSM